MKSKTLKIVAITLSSLVLLYFIISIVFPAFIGVPMAGSESYEEFEQISIEK